MYTQQQIEITNTLSVSACGELADNSGQISWIQRQKAQQRANQKHLAWMMGLSEDEYIGYKMKLLIKWMYDLLECSGYPDPEKSVYEYLQRKEIIGWWKNDWSQHDEGIMAMNLINPNKNAAKHFIMNYHIERVQTDVAHAYDLRREFFKLIGK